MNWDVDGKLIKGNYSLKSVALKKADIVIDKLNSILDATESKEIILLSEVLLDKTKELRELLDRTSKNQFKP